MCGFILWLTEMPQVHILFEVGNLNLVCRNSIFGVWMHVEMEEFAYHFGINVTLTSFLE